MLEGCATGLSAHPAARAWLQLGGSRAEPLAVHAISRKQKSQVYRLTGAGSGGETIIAKRCVRPSALLEAAIYDRILSPLPIRTLRLYGLAEEEAGEFAWLFFEDAGEQAFDPDDTSHRRLAGEWLTQLHDRAAEAEHHSWLPDRSPRAFRQSLRQARDNMMGALQRDDLRPEHSDLLRGVVARLDPIDSLWDAVEAQCTGLPETLVHNDFVPKNLRVGGDRAGRQSLLVMDWEMAGWGIPVADLAGWRLHDVYHDHWPAVDKSRLARLARFGHLFRLLAAIEWISQHFLWLSHSYKEKPFQFLQSYEKMLADLLDPNQPDGIGALLSRKESLAVAARARSRPNGDFTLPGNGIRPAAAADKIVPAGTSAGTFDYPELKELEEGLRHALASRNIVPDGRLIAVTGRRRNDYASSHPSEILECRHGDGRQVDLLCKYSACLNTHHLRFDHRGGIPYEAFVYDLLDRLGVYAAPFYGSYENTCRNELWLFIEFLNGALRLNKTGKQFNSQAAEWIARFHASAEARVDLKASPYRLYDSEYYSGWIQRTIAFSQPFIEEYQWLETLGERSHDALTELSAQPVTSIHGEYYPHNILVHCGKIAPVDWESAALGPGEIDLAAMTDGAWGSELIASCEEAYAKTRWPGGAPKGFRRRLALSRLYIHFRWLGERPERTRKESGRFERLRAVGQELGLI